MSKYLLKVHIILVKFYGSKLQKKKKNSTTTENTLLELQHTKESIKI